MSVAIRFREAKASPLRAPKSASREISSISRRAARRKPAYALAASRENRRRYDEARQDRQSLQTDPVGYEDDLNLYQYVHNDPLNLADPTGRDTEVRLLGFIGGTAPGRGEWGHSYVEVTNTDTGERYIAGSGQTGYNNLRAPFDSPTPGVTLRAYLVPAGEAAETEFMTENNVTPETLATTTLPGDTTNGVLRSLAGEVNRLNAADVPYRPQSQNSNTFAGDAYEAATGATAPVDSTRYPGSQNDLAIKDIREKLQ